MKAAGPSLSPFQLVAVCVLGLCCVAALVAGSRHLEAKSVAGATAPVQAATFEPRVFAHSAADREPTAPVQAFAPPTTSEPRPAAKPVELPVALDPEPIDSRAAASVRQTRATQKRARTQSRDRSADRPVATAQAGDSATPRRQRASLVISKGDSAGAICFRLKAGGGRCTQRL